MPGVPVSTTSTPTVFGWRTLPGSSLRPMGASAPRKIRDRDGARPAVANPAAGACLSGIEAPQASVSSRKADSHFWVTKSWAQLRNWAPAKKAAARSAPSSTALKKFAPSRWAPDRSAPQNFVPRRSAPRRSARERSNPLKSSPRRPARDKSGVSSCLPATHSTLRHRGRASRQAQRLASSTPVKPAGSFVPLLQWARSS